jgi:hypothetical protein
MATMEFDEFKKECRYCESTLASETTMYAGKSPEQSTYRCLRSIPFFRKLFPEKKGIRRLEIEY